MTRPAVRRLRAPGRRCARSRSLRPPGRADDLWERVEEELGSAGKRDTGALSWPAIELPVFRESPGSPGEAVPPGEAGPRDTVTRGTQRLDMGTGSGLEAA